MSTFNGSRKWMQLVARLTLAAGVLLLVGSAQAEDYTLKVTFRGIVDLVTDGDENPKEAWILIPDMEVPANLPLKDSTVGITAHRAVLLVDGDTSTPTYSSCHDGIPRHAIDIRDQHVTIAVTSNETQLLINRALRDGARPLKTEKSLEWLADMDLLAMVSSIDGKYVPLRTDLLNSSYVGGLLASRVHLDRGRIRTSSFVPNDKGAELQVPLPGVARAMGHTFQTEILVTGPATVKLRPLTDITGSVIERIFSPADGKVLHLIIENEVKRVSGNCPDTGYRDFAGHYVLRQSSETLVPFIPAGVDPHPGSDPQCSPADNSWP